MKCNAFPGFSSPVLLSQKLIETVERAQHAALNAWHRGSAKPWVPWQNHAIAMLDTAPRRVICPTRRRHRNSELLQFLRTIKANRLAGLVCSTGRCTTRTRTGRTRRLQSEGGWHSMPSFMCISSRVVLAGPNRLRAGLQGYRVTGLQGCRGPLCAPQGHIGAPGRMQEQRLGWCNHRSGLGAAGAP